MHRSQVLAIYVLVVFVVMAGAVTALLATQKSISSIGSIKGLGLGIYWDPQCTNETSSLNFGQLEPESSKNFTLYLKNEGNSVLTLNMTSENWNPSNAVNYMTLTWDQEAQQVNPEEVTDFVIILSVSENIQSINSFSFHIIISGIG